MLKVGQKVELLTVKELISKDCFNHIIDSIEYRKFKGKIGKIVSISDHWMNGDDVIEVDFAGEILYTFGNILKIKNILEIDKTLFEL